MYIHEAVRMAREKNALIVRLSAKLEGSTRYAAIKPTDTYDTCMLVVIAGEEVERACRCWNPTADDLTAGDWTVLRDKFGNDVENVKLGE